MDMINFEFVDFALSSSWRDCFYHFDGDCWVIILSVRFIKGLV